MNLTEKSAYIKGLVDNSDLDMTTKEGKVLSAVIDLLSDMSLTVSDLEDSLDAVTEQVDLIDEDLETIENDYYGEDNDDDFEDEDDYIKIDCPSCGDSIYIDDAILKDGELLCPNCGERLEFDVEGDCEGCDGEGCEDCDK